MKQLALQIAQARVSKGWTFTELSNQCGLVTDRLHEIENGDMKRITINDLVKVAKALGMCVVVDFKKPKVEDDGGEAMTARPPRTDAQPTGTGA